MKNIKNILILGNGGREQTIMDILYRNNNDINCECSCVESFEKIKEICVKRKIDLVIPSTEVYLCGGIRDYLQKELEDIMVFGPNKYQSQIEGSKYYSKKLMEELEIPTSNFA